MEKHKRKPKYTTLNETKFIIVEDEYDQGSETEDIEPSKKDREGCVAKIGLITAVIGLVTALITLIAAIIPITNPDGTQTKLIVVIVEAVFHVEIRELSPTETSTEIFTTATPRGSTPTPISPATKGSSSGFTVTHLAATMTPQ